jgi:nucleoside-diphosphate-sugar epimerase
VLSDLVVLVVEPDTFIGLDMVLEIESLGGKAVGPVFSLAEAHGAIAQAPVAAALINADIDQNVCELCARLETMSVPHVVHSSSGAPPWGITSAPHFTRPVDARMMLHSLACEVTRLAAVRPQHV